MGPEELKRESIKLRSLFADNVIKTLYLRMKEKEAMGQPLHFWGAELYLGFKPLAIEIKSRLKTDGWALSKIEAKTIKDEKTGVETPATLYEIVPFSDKETFEAKLHLTKCLKIDLGVTEISKDVPNQQP